MKQSTSSAFATPLHPSSSLFVDPAIGACSRRPVSINQQPRPIRLPARVHHSATQTVCNASTPNSPWQTLTPQQFTTKLESNDLCLCFVGMSNCGKSHWTKQLESKLDFYLISVDDRIEDAIRPELDALGFSGIDGMAEWMGFPSDERFAANQAKYLRLEQEITEQSKPVHWKNTALDTTGSVVYLSDTTIADLQHDYLVVHLEASDDMLQFMTDSYFETPKPVVWGDVFQPNDGESADETLRRCYPNLLTERRKRYSAMAHVTVPAKYSLSRSTSLDDMLGFIQMQLGSKTGSLVA